MPPRPGAVTEPAALLLAALLIAGCGLCYQLILATLATWLVGNGILQFSLTIGGFLAAMGIGAWASARVVDLPGVFRRSELLLSLIGGHSALILLAAWAWSEAIWPAVFGGLLLVLGGLIGLELPLLLRWARRYAALRQTVARLFAADYLGALLAGLAFPLLLLPLLGLVRTAFLVGLINWATVLLTHLAFRERPGRGATLALIATGLLLGAGLYYGGPAADRIERTLYADPVVHASQSSYQRIVLTARDGDLRLFLDGELQFSSRDEYRYHEALIQPALALAQSRQPVASPSLDVLVIGGGDGLGVRELLRHAVGRVVLVDLDPAMVELARNHAALRGLNTGAFDDPRVEIIHADGFRHVREQPQRYPLIVLDLPDPRSEGLARLYSREFHGLLRQRLTPGGVLVTQASSPLYVREAYWTVVATLESAGFRTLPIHASVPSFGPWGFVIATPSADPPPAPTLLPAGLRSLEPDAWTRLSAFPPDMARLPTEISTLTQPRVWQAYERAMRGG
ncbi:MAG: polyamine aminopropyltransferase [Xanthomonadales bacterium]|jgi:spermidine synthase|nr:polyamine aminopropyltransferase [Xanthomonadales bacterium]